MVAKIGRIFLKIFGILLSIVLLLLILINLPFVQNQLTGYAERFLKDKTGASITIEKVAINFLGHILIREVMVPDQQQDTLLHLGKLEVGFQLREILQKKIRIKKVELDDVLVDLHPAHDTVMNYQFLIDAFSKPGAPKPEPEPEKKKAGKPWQVVFPGTNLGLNNVRFNYLQPDSVMVMNYRVGKLEGKTDQVNLATGDISVDRLALANSDVYIKSLADDSEPPDTSASNIHYNIEARELSLSDINYRMDLDDLSIDSHVGTAVASSNKMLLAPDTMRINVERFDLADSHYRMDTPSAPPSPGLDYRHLDLDGIQIRISDFSYDNLDINGQVEQLAARDQCGFELSGFNTRIHYNPDSIELWQLHAFTPQTRINAEHGKVTFPFLEDSTLFEQMLIELQLDSTIIHPVDVAYFVPQLEDQDFFRQHREQPLHLDARIEGTLADMAIERFDLQGWDARVTLDGHLKHVTDMDRLESDLQISAIESTGPGIRRWLPPGALPANIELPSDVLIRGWLRGPLNRLDFDLEATTSRPAQPLAARLEIEGEVRNLMDTKRLAYDVGIDTLWVSRQEANAYLPDSFPAYIVLPEAVTLTGELHGTMDTVFADLDLEAVRDSQVTVVKIAGTVDSFTNAKAIAFDLKLQELIIQPGEITAYLPADALPDYLQLPKIEHGEGAVRGNLANLNADVDILTSDGHLDADVKLKDSAFVALVELDSFQLQGLFKDSLAYDTVVGWPAPPIALEVAADGQGLDIENDLTANASVRLRFQGDTINWKEGLLLKGAVDRKSFRGKLTVHENEIDLDLNALANLNPGMDTASLDGAINKLDLYALKLMKVPFDARTRLAFNTKGIGLDSISAVLTARDFHIRYDEITESSETFSAVLMRDTSQNMLVGLVISDFVTAIGVDQGHDPEHFYEGLDDLAHNLEMTDYSQFELNPDSTKNFYAELAITRPGIFTSGIIPGLTELEPIELQAAIDLQDSSFAVYGNIPHVKYSSFVLDSTKIGAVNWGRLFFGQILVQHANLFDKVDVKALSLSALSPGSNVDSVFVILDQKDSTLAPDTSQLTRFNVTAQLIREPGQYRARFLSPPILNFSREWQFDTSNEIIFNSGEKALHVRNLRLFHDDHSLTINEVADKRLQVSFDNFDLQFLSDIIKWKSDFATGVANGQVVVDDPLGGLRLRSDLKVSDLAVLDSPLGDLGVQASNDDAGAWMADVTLSGQGNEVTLNGKYTPDPDSAAQIEGKLLSQPLHLATLGPMVEGVVSDLDGDLSTDLTFSGSIDKPVILGSIGFDKVFARPAITGSRLEIPEGAINFTKNAFMTDKAITLLDSLGNEAQFSLLGVTQDFRSYYVSGGLSSDNFLLLNTTEEDNDLYYGKVFSEIEVSIAGETSRVIDIKCDISPKEGSTLVYLFDRGDQLKDIDTGEGFVEFVDFDIIDEAEQDTTAMAKDTVIQASGFDIEISADLNKNLGLTVVMDREAGDRLEGKVEGKVAFRYPPNGDMELTGQMGVAGSKYFYTYQKVIKKEFELLDGSTITFTGPLDNADINLKAGYTAKTSPYMLVAAYGDVESATGSDALDRLKRRQEFQVIIQAQGTLEAAELNANIEYPRKIGNTSADVVEPALTNLQANSTEMNTQAFSLILFNSFRLSDGSSAGKSIFNLKQELGDILASQLNSLANQYINFAEVNFDIETLSDEANNVDFKNVDFRLGLRKRFLDDRLVVEVDGVASTGRLKKDEYGKTYSEENMQAFLENVSVEYSLNEKGSLRIRVFNQYDYDDFIGSNVIKLGGTLVVSKSFNRLIFKKKHEPANPRPEPPTIHTGPVDDSTGVETPTPQDSIQNRQRR